jgi:hypothetical protein
MRALLEARAAEPTPPAPTELDAFLESLDERFHPDRVNAHLWHCRTQEEFDRERDLIQDPEEELHAQPDLDGGHDNWFTDRN